MTGEQRKHKGHEIGLVGLGVMGRNLLLNMADHGISVAGYDMDPAQVEALRNDSAGREIGAAVTVDEFVGLLRGPRAIMMFVPAGPAVDSVIRDLAPHLERGDIVIDAGNSHFRDTDARAAGLAKNGVHFLGVGVSGGEEGARRGPSIMPGGPKEAYDRVRPVFEAVAARVRGEPCVTWLGPGSAGHFVKMVHNGIEYAIMQLIAETYDLMKRGLGLDNDELHRVYASWNEGELSGYLVEITAHIFCVTDNTTGKRLIDEILGVARQKGTGMWTSQCAMELQVPVPTIDLAVAMRDLSVFAKERGEAGAIYQRSTQILDNDRDMFITSLSRALYAATMISYAQGMALLTVASEKFGYNLDLEAVARLWRGGCIIRSAMLDEICAAFHSARELPNVLLAPDIGLKLRDYEEDFRHVVCRAATSGIPAPGLMASLGYFDAYRSGWLPANLVQAQRDYFGAHTYERIDASGSFHTEWEKS